MDSVKRIMCSIRPDKWLKTHGAVAVADNKLKIVIK